MKTRPASFEDVEALLARVSTDHVVPGVAAAGVVDGSPAIVAAHGWRDQERRLPMTADTPSRWYSISKPLTALAVARHVAAGRLHWDRKVKDLVPGVCFADAVSTERATIRDCLLHRTGLASGDWVWIGGPSDPLELLKRLPHVSCRPGYRAGFNYQNLNFTIVGEVFKAIGTDWHSAVRDLLAPIGVKPLTRLQEFKASDRALGYGPNGFTPPHPAEDFDFEAIAPASAVCGSITELSRLAAAMSLGGKGLLPADAWNESIRPVFAQGPREWPEMRAPCAAMAGVVVVYRGELVLQWAGGFRGYVAHVLAMPERRAAGCALANRTASSAAELLAWSLLDRAVGWEPLPWADRFLEQKRNFRRAGERRMAERLARPAAPWPGFEVRGRFRSGAYGELEVVDGPVLKFRNVELPMRYMPDGTVSAEGSTRDFSELFWSLRLEVEAGRAVAWHFNPDDPLSPYRFARQ
jgi:CubicO group peptidase (beta-lactamase class C family)